MSRTRAESLIVEIPDYPTPGVVFKDLTPVFADHVALDYVLGEVAAHFAESDVSTVAGIEARGFIFGAALASHMHLGFVPIRKLNLGFLGGQARFTAAFPHVEVFTVFD